MDPLAPLPSLGPLGGAATPAETRSQAPGFGDLLQQALQDVNQVSAEAEAEARNLMTGQGADMHTAMLAVQKAELNFQMMMAVRSKLIDAYREVMRMQM